MSPSRPFLLLTLVLAGLVGCEPAPLASSTSPTGAVRLALSLPTAVPGDVARVAVTVSGADMVPRTAELALTEGVWRGILEHIPVGPRRAFRAQALTASGTVRYEGQVEDVSIVEGTTALLALTLQDVILPAPFLNEAPFVESLAASHILVAPGGTVSLRARAWDPNPEDTVSYRWTAPSGVFSAPGQASTTWTAPSSPGPVRLTLTVSDSQGAAVSVSHALNVSATRGADEVRVDFNTAPRLVGIASTRSVLDVGEPTALTVSVTDADGDALGYQWSATCSGTFTGATAASATFTPSVLPTAVCHNCQLRVTVTDGRGGQNTGTLALCVSKNGVQRAPPTLTRSLQSSLTATARQPITFEVGASDPAGSALRFTWKASAGTLATATFDGFSSRVVWTAPACRGTSTPPGITATVTNAFGLTVTRSFVMEGIAACDASSWTPAGALAFARRDHTATRLPDGRVLVAGGYNGGSYLAACELYDPATGAWSVTGALAKARYLHTATPLPDGRVLVAGGSSSGNMDGSELYDPTTGRWSLGGSLRQGRAQHTATPLPDGRVLVVGGSSSGNLTSAELYDPATGAWNTTSAMSTTRAQHTATPLPDGRVLIVGSGSAPRLRTEVYDPATRTWISGSSPQRRYAHTATRLLDGRVLLAGGYDSSYVETAELYDPATGTLSSTGSLAVPRGWHRATLLPSGQVLVTGGSNSEGLLAPTEIYNPATGTWRLSSSLGVPRVNHEATLLPSGEVLVSGGDATGDSARTAELYHPAPRP